MQITKVEILEINLPLIHPFTTSFGTVKKRSTVLVKLTSKNGMVGWGEAAALPAPLYSYETVKTEQFILKEFLISWILNKNFSSIGDFVQSYQAIKGHNFAKCGLESSFWCLWSLENKKSLSSLFGGTRKKISVGESIGIKKTIEKTLEEIKLRLFQGYQRIKIKIKPNWDVKIVEAIRKKFGNILLMVDANSSYTLNDIKVFQTLDNFELLMIEQPLSESDIIDHSVLQKLIKTPLCLDESILSVDDARKAIAIGACKIINIKPGRVGGLYESIKIHDFCKEKNIPVWCGGMLESGIGRSFNIALSSLPNFTLPADMSPSTIFYKEDLIQPTYEVDVHGNIEVPDKIGLGYDVDEKKIKKYTTSKFCLTS